MPPLRRILLVDDEPDIRTVVRLALETVGGYSVCVCASAAEALERIEDFRPDLVLLDVMLPDMEGPVALERLRERPGGEAVPVVFLTARVQSEAVETLYRAGAADVIQKPFDPMRLADEVRDAWNRCHEP
jgi:CheY-like chemotaxis protein